MQRFVGFRLMAKPPPFDSLLREVSDAAVREAFRRVDRERFVPWALKLCAWDDRPLPIG
jgi:protein-L-isoaspartate O-methyltransferase